MKTNLSTKIFSRKMFMQAIVSALFFLPLFESSSLRAQNLKDNFELKEVVVLSRHNIRAPLSGKNSILGKITTHEWTNWTANASELTSKGGVLETMMGQYFRKWFESEGLFKEGACPTTDEVNIYANSMQRTIATAEYFSAGFSPTCGLLPYHRYSPSKMDPVFFPRLTKVTDSFKQKAMEQIAAMGGKNGVVGINEKLKESYSLVEKVTDMKNSPACKDDKTCALDDYNTQFTFQLGEEPNLKGSLKVANTIADALILQYLEEQDDLKASFGNKMTMKDWESISKIKDVYGDALFSAPIVAVNVAHPLLEYMRDELKSKDRKFTFLVGHDSNICSLLNALSVEEYSLPNTIEKKTPIGSKLVFEKWVEKATKKEFVNVRLIYQTTEQLRFLKPLNLSNPPASYPIKFNGLTANSFGLYSMEDVIAQFGKAIAAYEDIK